MTIMTDLRVKVNNFFEKGLGRFQNYTNFEASKNEFQNRVNDAALVRIVSLSQLKPLVKKRDRSRLRKVKAKFDMNL